MTCLPLVPLIEAATTLFTVVALATALFLIYREFAQ